MNLFEYLFKDKLEFIKWLFPIRYRYYEKKCKEYGIIPISYWKWEDHMRKCKYTTFKLITFYKI